VFYNWTTYDSIVNGTAGHGKVITHRKSVSGRNIEDGTEKYHQATSG
jgi:hypothetical protein